jgi:hypothetical protein
LVSRSKLTRRRIAMDWGHCARDAQTLVGIRERLMQSCGASVCPSEVGRIFVGVPVALLCMVTVESAWHGEAPWGSGLTTAALTAAILAVVSLFAGAVWLSISNWMAGVRSRVTWAAIGAVTDESSSVPLVDPPNPDDLYPHVLGNETIRAVLHAHRHSMPVRAVGDVRGMEGTDRRTASLPSTASIAEISSVLSGADSFPTDNACRPTGTLAIGAALRVVSSVNKTGSNARQSFRTIASDVAPSGGKARGANVAARSRRTVNGGRGDDLAKSACQVQSSIAVA